MYRCKICGVRYVTIKRRKKCEQNGRFLAKEYPVGMCYYFEVDKGGDEPDCFVAYIWRIKEFSGHYGECFFDAVELSSPDILSNMQFSFVGRKMIDKGVDVKALPLDMVRHPAFLTLAKKAEKDGISLRTVHGGRFVSVKKLMAK